MITLGVDAHKQVRGAVALDDSGRELDERSPDHESPFMLLVARVGREKRHLLPSVTHVEGTARVQTVRRDLNPLFYELIEEFGRLTDVPVVLNTSFNVRGEPIVCTPEEAFNCFPHTDLDYLGLGDALVPSSSRMSLRGADRGRRVQSEAHLAFARLRHKEKYAVAGFHTTEQRGQQLDFGFPTEQRRTRFFDERAQVAAGKYCLRGPLCQPRSTGTRVPK
jgi:Carbamoyltransferase C-terminus